MAKNIGQLTATQTFQNWFDKTNTLISELATTVITATPQGDTTTGDATLIGDFTASNLIASTLLSSDEISSASGGVINFQDPIQITGTSATTATFLFAGTGGQTRYTDGNISWDIGLENSNPGNFIIDTGTGANKFQLSVAGTLTVPDAVITGSLTCGSLSIGPGGSGLSTDDVSEGSTNLYYLDSRARAAFSAGDGINISSGGVISFDGQGELDTYTGNKFIPTGSKDSDGDYVYIDGAVAVGVPLGRLTTYWATNTYNVLTWMPAGISVIGYGQFTDDISTSGGDIRVKDGSTVNAFISNSGDGYFVGDVTTNGSASDERLKENIVKIDDALTKVLEINGYTFNYKDKPEERLPGVIAQEIEKVLPEVVYNVEIGAEEEQYKAVRYGQIVPLLIEAIKELSGKVKDLENRLENNG